MDAFSVFLILGMVVSVLWVVYYQSQFVRLLLKGLYEEHRKLFPLAVGLTVCGVGLFLNYVLDFLFPEDVTDLDKGFDFLKNSLVLLVFGMLACCALLCLLVKAKSMNKDDWKQFFSRYALFGLAILIFLYIIFSDALKE